MSDVIIVGGGPAGLAAAIYARRAGLAVTLLEKEPMPGGQMATTPEIENYPGVGRIDGFTLSQQMAADAAALGVEPATGQVTGLDLAPGAFAARTGEETYAGRSVILAMGSRRRRLDIPGENELAGKGISWCAVCDGFFFRGKPVAVIGGGNTALEDALHLAKLGCGVTLIHRRDAFRAGRHLIEQVEAEPKIQLHTPYAPVRFQETPDGIGITLRRADDPDAAETEWTGAGVFECVGTIANTELLGDCLPLTAERRIAADEDTRTAIPGVFAAGDIREKPLYQIVSAAADGAAAATAAAEWLLGAP